MSSDSSNYQTAVQCAPPEFLKGMTTGRQADTWAIGNILYYMANFEYPFGDPVNK